MNYFALVDTSTNKIEVGPRSWNIKFWKRFLTEQNITFDEFPHIEPTEKFIIPSSTYVILPTFINNPPAMDDFYQQPAGPYYTIGEDSITGIFQIGEKSIDSIVSRLKQEATAVRYKVEVSGTSVNGTIIPTDRESQSLITSVRVKSDNDNSKVFNWKGENGWVTMDRNAVVFFSDTIFDYVEDCFDKEKLLHEAIDSAVTDNIGNYEDTITALQAIDINDTFGIEEDELI